MDNINLTYRKVFKVLSTTFLMKLYKFAYDNKSLANPKTFAGLLTPLNIALKFLIPRVKSNIVFSINIDSQWKTIVADGRNTQYHALYFSKFKNGYELEIMALLDLLLESTDVFYDIGSNWGYFSLYALSQSKYKGKVFAFDPQPEICDDLLSIKKQLSLNNLSVLNIGLSEYKNNNAHFDSPDGFHSGIFQIKSGDVGTYKIDTLDSLSIELPHVIKIDVEGMETQVIRGGRVLLEKAKPYLLIESPKTGRDELLTTLHSMDYSVYGIYINKVEDGRVVLNLNPYNINSIEKNILAIPNVKLESFKKLLI